MCLLFIEWGSKSQCAGSRPRTSRPPTWAASLSPTPWSAFSCTFSPSFLFVVSFLSIHSTFLFPCRVGSLIQSHNLFLFVTVVFCVGI